MEKIRTGLVLETMESANASGISHKARVITDKKDACTVTTVIIDNDADAKKIGREKGTYVTVEMDKMCKITDTEFEYIITTIAKTVRSMINISFDNRIMVAGLGNRNITPDSLGPKCIDRIIVTRGLEKTCPELISDGSFLSVCAITSNVFGVTGIESAELIGGIADKIKPALIIVVDSLATTSLDRLCKTVQISNTSITPGGGVDNKRQEISSKSLGIPVLTLGVPTVIDVSTLLLNCGTDKKQINDFLGDYSDSLIATPSTIDTATDIAAKLIAFSLNKVFHYDMTTEDILKFLY